MTRLVLLRHGQTADPGRCAGRLHDPGLSAEGRRQAAAAVHRLRFRIDAVTCSPARRARETAQAWDPEPFVDERFAERNFGEWEGRPWAELWPTVPPSVTEDHTAYAAFTPPGAETIAQVRARAWAAAEHWTGEVAGTPPGGTVLVVTHAGPLRLMVAAALGLPETAAFMLGAERGRAAVLLRSAADRWTLDQLGA